MKIQNKKQWFLMLNETAEKVKQYEDAVIKYNRATGAKIDTSRPLCRGFYKKTPKFNYVSKKAIKRLPVAIVMAAITWVFVFIASLINSGKSVGVDNPIQLFSLFGASCASKALAFGLIMLFVVIGIFIGFAFLDITKLFKKFSQMENDLTENLSTVPPSYRTSEKILTLTEIYFTRQSLSLKSIFEVCDDWLMENAKSKFHSIMFDVDYKPIFNDEVLLEVGTTDTVVETVNDDNPALNNPNLPSDITSKTFEGSTDSKIDLDAMIGLDSVKQQIYKFENRIKFYGENSSNNGNHMTFLGSAGTGKTSVARIITKILFDLGYIKKNQYVEISGDYLKSGSSSRASAIIDYAMGGVLFIDEAYLLYDKNGNSAEATGVLLKAMEDRRSDFVVILAGYEEQMTRLIASNEGFSSRIKHTIYFPDYTPDEMLDIFNYFISNYNGHCYKLELNASIILKEAFELETKAKSFGNARTVRNAVDAIMDYYADRSIATNSNSCIITANDVQRYYEDRQVVLRHELRNASAANQVDESIIRLSELKPKLKSGSENPEEDFNNLIGLDGLVEEIAMLKSQKDFYNEIQHQRILLVGECNYKEQVLSALTGSLYKLGYIDENKFLDISADFMKGSYVGHTTKRAESIISYASGGVLAISNLNLLVEQNDNFGQEVISIITTALQENENITVVILDNNSEFIQNSIESLCTMVYEFPEYDSSQLYQIFKQYADADGFTIEEKAIEKINSIINSSVQSTNELNKFYDTVKKNHIANFDGVNNRLVITEKDISLRRTSIKIKLNDK